ncbi:MAG: 23S rRNA (uracil(1939)-C(5))-methyltransferase RlmD [Aerococcus sp.]|nr:23S rRNA (uracil(1939)-C(5))-methyltransferase RlmD [Aerococcus sp.]
MKQALPVTKNQTLTVTIEDLTYEGLGVAKVDGYPLFIADALPSETCDIHVTKALKHYGYAKVIKRHNNAPERQQFTDSDWLKTGTMPLAHLKYDAQLAFKKQQVINNLQKHGLLEQTTVLNPLGMADPWRYRNKAQVPVGMVDNELVTGFYRRGSHRLIPMTNYHIQYPAIDQTLQQVVKILNDYQITAYDENTHRGLLRHIVVREGYYTKEQMVILVINGDKLPHEEAIVRDLTAALSNLVSLVLNSNTRNTNVILGHKDRILWGSKSYDDRLFDMTFHISAHSFFQVNVIQAERLYEEALQRAKLTGNEIVVDAYCGIGTLSLCLAKQAKTVYGVEIVPDAITMAKQNAADNQITNANFVTGKAEELMPQWVDDGLKPDVVVVDPPRKGLDQKFIQSVIDVAPEKIVYVSCNPATLARDLRKFVDAGYALGDVQPVDMFPHTTHVECVVLMSKIHGRATN